MRINGINKNAMLNNRGAIIMEIKYWKRNMMYNLAQHVNGQPLGIVEIPYITMPSIFGEGKHQH